MIETPESAVPAPLASSFRDPSGFLYVEDGQIYRHVRARYLPHYRRLIDSNLYKNLVAQKMLIPHEEVVSPQSEHALKRLILRPERIPFISYPYEWSFGQLRDAALLTLDIQKQSLEAGMTLKDASAYNIQWIGSRPVLIDSLSFETYSPGSPWIAYHQFCRHFLAPLAVMAYGDLRAGQFLRAHLDGLPLDMAAKLLPSKAWWNWSLFCHIGLHQKFQSHHAQSSRAGKNGQPRSSVSLHASLAVLESLRRTVAGLRIKKSSAALWSNYYGGTCSYSESALAHKQEILGAYLDRMAPKTVWDLGANTGLFSRQACERKMQVVAFDLDPVCVEACYRQARMENNEFLLPLVMDLSNSSPSLGWAHEERYSLAERAPADLLLALALVHHLAISHNLPLSRIADYLSRLGDGLVVEFVPKTDPQTQKLLSGREDIFDRYTREEFETEFAKYFTILDSTQVRETDRKMYLMKKKVL